MIRKTILASLIIILIAFAASAKEAIDLTYAGGGARPLALGQAYVAVADDVNAVFTNPAGLGDQKIWGLTSMSTKLFDRVEYKLVGGTVPTSFGTIGFGYISATTPAGFLTTDKTSLSSAVPLSYGSSMMILAYGRDLNELIKGADSLGKLSVGANYKMITNRFDGTSGSGTGSSVDLGLKLDATDRLTFGLSLKNLSGSVNWETGNQEYLPATTVIGCAYRYGKGLAAVDYEFADQVKRLRGGIEYQPIDFLVLRAGLGQVDVSASETALGVSGGLGLKIEGVSVDYTYKQDPTINANSSHYLSVSFQPQEKSASLVSNQPPQTTVATAPLDGVFTLKKSVSAEILKYYK